MLIQLPSGSPDQQGPQNAELPSATFEAGLRRDLASASIVSYDSMLGGWGKRAIDLTLAVIVLPVWAPLMLLAAAWAKLRHRGQVFVAHGCVGYGGRAFNCFSLRIAPPSATIEQLHAGAPAANDLDAIADQAATRGAKWRRAFERLPRFFNVIRGDMALVGPAPLTREELEPLKSARRYYLSARPGVVGVSTIIGGTDDPSQYKIYAMSWAVTTDALILWDALRSLRDRGELWQPSFARAAPGQSTSGVVVRRRNSPA
jgi:lipopolysaccharide/colanic/teichoic acid biosynthesis glycosyltransferase